MYEATYTNIADFFWEHLFRQQPARNIYFKIKYQADPKTLSLKLPPRTDQRGFEPLISKHPARIA